jgi:hypothetical protein
MKHDLLGLFMQMPCAECGKKPCHAAFILDLKKGGKPEYFNYLPLCVKHCSEQMRIGTLAMCVKYSNVRLYLSHKGWSTDGELKHKDAGRKKNDRQHN